MNKKWRRWQLDVRCTNSGSLVQLPKERDMSTAARSGARHRPGPSPAARNTRGPVLAVTVLALVVATLSAATAWGSPSGARATASQAQTPLYLNPKLPVAQRVADL